MRALAVALVLALAAPAARAQEPPLPPPAPAAPVDPNAPPPAPAGAPSTAPATGAPTAPATAAPTAPPAFTPTPEDPYAQPAAPAAPATRTFGVSVSLGLGEQFVRDGDKYFTFLFPSLSLYLPVARTVGLELWLPVINLLLGNLFGERPWVWADLFVRIHPIARVPGLFIAPGFGFMYLTVSGNSGGSSGVVIDVPLRLGYEIDFTRGLAMSIAARPWIDFVLPLGPREGGQSYGFFFELGMSFYTTRR